MSRVRGFPLEALVRPIEWSFPAALSAWLLSGLWSQTPLELTRFPDRTIGIAVLQDYDVRARSMFVIEGLALTAIVCGLWLLASWGMARLLRTAGRGHSIGRLRRLLAPAHYLALFSIGAMVFQVPLPKWGPASNLGIALAIYFLAAALWMIWFQASPSVTHAVALAVFSVCLGEFRLWDGHPYSFRFAWVTGVAVTGIWAAGLVISRVMPRILPATPRLRSWLMLAMLPLLLLPAAPEIGQETAYFKLLRFGVATDFETVAARVAIELLGAAVVMLGIGLFFRRRKLRSSAWLFSRILLPVSLAAIVVACRMPRAGDAVKPDVHHWGEALLPLDQLLKFGSLPYIDLMPTHGLAANLGPLLHRIIYGCYAIDEFALGVMIALGIGYLSAYFFLRRAFGSPALAVLWPLMLPTVIEPSLGYAAPYYTVGLVVILVICRALRVWTTRAFVAAGFAVLAAVLLRLDVAVGTAMIGTVLIGLYAATLWRQAPIRRALGFFAVLGGAGAVYLAALLIRTGGLQRLAALRVFSSLDFQALHAVPLQLFSPLVSRYASNLFNDLAFPLSIVAVLMALVAAGRIAIRNTTGKLPDHQPLVRFLWRASIVIAVGAYNVLIFNRGLQRFNESMVGGGFLTQYEIGFSFLVIILAAQLFGVPRGGLATLWVIAVVLTAAGTPPEASFARLPLDLLNAPTKPAIPRAIKMNEFSARLYLTPDLLADWRNLRRYIDRNTPPKQTFVEISNQSLFHVAFNRRFPGFNIITFTAASEAIQQAYLAGWKPEVIPVALVRGGQGWLNDIDDVPDPVRNYRLYEQLYRYYQRDAQVGEFILYRSLHPAPPVDHPAISSDALKTVKPGVPLTVPTARTSVGRGEEATVSFQAECRGAVPLDVIFESEKPAQVDAVACAPGFSTPEDFSDYRIPSPLGFSGIVSAIRIEAGESSVNIRNVRVIVGPKEASLDQPSQKSTFNLEWLAFIWAQFDPMHAAAERPVLWSGAGFPIQIDPGKTLAMPLDLPAAPSSYIRIDAEAAADTSLVLNYAKAAVPLSTPKGFRFDIKGGRRALYLIRPSVQAYWYGDRSALREILLWNDSKTPVRIYGVAVQAGD